MISSFHPPPPQAQSERGFTQSSSQFTYWWMVFGFLLLPSTSLEKDTLHDVPYASSEEGSHTVTRGKFSSFRMGGIVLDESITA